MGYKILFSIFRCGFLQWALDRARLSLFLRSSCFFMMQKMVADLGAVPHLVNGQERKLNFNALVTLVD